jgi:dihydropteroate synthase
VGRRLIDPLWRGAEGVALLGIVNVTPDSFSDGGRWSGDAAVDHGLRLLDEGADLLDVGGESTRPGAAPVAEAEELRRVLPVIRGIVRARPGVRVSVDTSKPAVAAAALAEGAVIVNDVHGLVAPGMIAVAAAAGAGVVAMHMRGDPSTMDDFADYADLPGEVGAWLDGRARAAVAGGVPAGRVAIDPGLGFAKRGLQNAALIGALPRLAALGWPVVIGASRKRFVGEISRVDAPERRVAGSVGAALAAAARGAAVLRVHDVAATREALAVFRACGGLPA